VTLTLVPHFGQINASIVSNPGNEIVAWQCGQRAVATEDARSAWLGIVVLDRECRVRTGVRFDMHSFVTTLSHGVLPMSRVLTAARPQSRSPSQGPGSWDYTARAGTCGGQFDAGAGQGVPADGQLQP
jgi:hypothetical protein